MDVAQERMKDEYAGMRGAMTVPLYTFRYRLKKAAEEGLLITIKYGLVILLSYLGLTFGTNVVNGSNNGTAAALYLNELQNKGWLPKVQNGQVPMKENQNAPTNPIK